MLVIPNNKIIIREVYLTSFFPTTLMSDIFTNISSRSFSTLHTAMKNRRSSLFHCAKRVQIRSFSGPYFPVSWRETGLKTGKYGSEKLRIWTLFTQQYLLQNRLLYCVLDLYVAVYIDKIKRTAMEHYLHGTLLTTW